MRTIIRLTIVLLATLSATTASAEKNWAEKMFNKLGHNFGTVARGADTVYRFEVTNLYKETMHITNVTSSCGCTSPTIENGTIKSHGKGYVVARFNTRDLVGRKSATITVHFGAPYRAQVQLRVHGNIRGDVVFSPGAVQFGSVDEGEKHEQIVKVSYAGHDAWRIVDITNDNANFEVKLTETSRSRGRVNYDLLVCLKANHPCGFVQDQISVITNDSRTENRRIPLLIGGRVIPELSVTPAIVALGELQPGKPVTQRVLVRGKKPFRILDVSCGHDCLTFKTDNKSKVLHFVEITLNPGSGPATLSMPVTITTDCGSGKTATLRVSAKVVVPKTTSAGPASQVEVARVAN